MYDDNHLAHALRAANVGHEERTFAWAGEMLMSNGALWDGAERIAEGLADLGLEPGDRVAVQAEKSLTMLQLYLGTVLAGGVFVPLNTAYTDAELGYFLTDAAPCIVVCDPAREAGIASYEICGSERRLLTLDAHGQGSVWPEQEPNKLAAAQRGPDDLAAILYTSGTTGRSKGAMLTHGNLASNAKALAETWAFDRDDVLIHALPVFHTHGLFVATNVTLTAGSALLFHERFDSGRVVRDMSRASVLMGVPTFYVRLLQEPGLADAARDMRLFVSGSAPLLPETHAAWTEATSHAILERYGMSETNMNASNPYDGERRPGTVGQPLPEVEIRITDTESGEALAAGEVGSIEVKGPNVFPGYWRMPEKTAEEFRSDGFFITGDLGTMSGDGYLAIVGRSKDLIISGGYNVYPKEVELAIDALDGIAESAVIGVPHPDFGEAVVAVVVVSGAAVPPEWIASRLKSELARYKHPKKIVFANKLPRNAMGKVQKKALREHYAKLFAALV